MKKQYRQKSKLLHPDAGGSEEAFKEFSGAFDRLKQLYQMGSHLFDAEPMVETLNSEPAPPRMPRETVDGTPLSELGLGLGPTTNGRDCPDCDHRGYTILEEHGRVRCKKCKGTGMQAREYICRACSGSGKFIQHHTRRIVDCRVCQGTGNFKHPVYKEWCTACDGIGTTTAEVITYIYARKCWSCNGTGEIEVLNPVLPKGRIVFRNCK